MSPLALSLHFLQAQSDSRLLALAREGHEPAFEALVRRYRKELLAYCRRLQPRSGSAEDALQQTLLQAWRALRSGAEVREARPWLYRIAHNVSLNQLRVAVAVPQEVTEEAGGQEVHQLVEQRLQARAALAGMAALPALQRNVFVSTTLDGASHEEVASALGLSSGAVRGLIYRARATLRSAAAALIPNPVVHWAIRRAESRTGGGVISEALAGGGGAGVAAAIAKGGAVLTLAGAVAGAGGVIFTHHSIHHRRHEPRAPGLATRGRTQPLVAQVNASTAELATASALRGAGIGLRAGNRLGQTGEDHGGSRRGSTGEEAGRSRAGSDSGSSTTSSTGSDGGSLGGATSASSSDGSNPSSSDGSSGSSTDGSGGAQGGGSSGPSVSSTSPTSGSGGTSDGGPGPSSGTQLTSAQMTSDGGPGSDGGPASSTTSSSGSGETTTISTSGSGETTTTSSH